MFPWCQPNKRLRAELQESSEIAGGQALLRPRFQAL
jgi:hypothetical protein